MMEFRRGEGPRGVRMSSVSKDKTEEYNSAMRRRRRRRNPYEYHHDLGMNYTLLTRSLRSPEDIDHLKNEENVAYILNLQQVRDVEYWRVDLQSILRRCGELGIRHSRRPARDFPGFSEKGITGRPTHPWNGPFQMERVVYVHCTAGLGRAPTVAIAYMFWFCEINLDQAYDMLTSKRPHGPSNRAIRGATYDPAKDDTWKEPFESLPDYAFGDTVDWERNPIQDRVRSLRET